MWSFAKASVGWIGQPRSRRLSGAVKGFRQLEECTKTERMYKSPKRRHGILVEWSYVWLLSFDLFLSTVIKKGMDQDLDILHFVLK